MSLLGWALWGLLGAFVYAAPRLLVALSEAGAGAALPWRKAVAEFFVSLTFGPIGAAGFGPYLAATLSHSSLVESRAMALVIGLVANPVAPGVVHLLHDGVLRYLGGALKETKRR